MKDQREIYKEKCKHYSGYSGQCYAASGTTQNEIGSVHYNMNCDGKCRRMKNYDKKKNNLKKFLVKAKKDITEIYRNQCQFYNNAKDKNTCTCNHVKVDRTCDMKCKKCRAFVKELKEYIKNIDENLLETINK